MSHPGRLNYIVVFYAKIILFLNIFSPGTYNIDYKRKYTYYDSFGGKKLPIPATKTLCLPIPLTICDKCGLKVKGDFWQKISPLCTYCKSCMENEKDRAKYSIKKKNLKFRRLAELNSFDVSFVLFYMIHLLLIFYFRIENSRLYILPSTWRHNCKCKTATETRINKAVSMGALFIPIFNMTETIIFTIYEHQ